jgi:phosphoglycerate dehydrogenase-like enzyme
MLSLCRGIVSYDEALRQDPVGNWEFRIAPAVRRLRGATFGVVGLGRIGTAAALRARGFGMAVVFYDPYLPSGAELALDIGRARSLHELLGRSDVVSLHAPLTDETRGMMNQDAFAAMRPGAVLINTARGPICELPPLAAALRSGRLAGAGLDVLPDEPPDPADPLIQAWRGGEPWVKGRLLITPHAAFFSAAAFEDMRRKSLETAMLYLREGRLQNCVNRRWLQQRDTV